MCGVSREKVRVPAGWRLIWELSGGAQARTFLVKRGKAAGKGYCVLKRYKDQNDSASFDAEVEALTALRHPNILGIVDHGEAEGFYLITNYCDGGTLPHRDLSGLNVMKRLHLFREMCIAMAEVHQCGMAHCDLHLNNIFFRYDGTPVIGDFGKCRPVTPNSRKLLGDVRQLGDILCFLMTKQCWLDERRFHRTGLWGLPWWPECLETRAEDVIYWLLDRAWGPGGVVNASELLLQVDAQIGMLWSWSGLFERLSLEQAAKAA